MKQEPEVAQRLSEVCVKLMLTALGLSAVVFGLADKYQEAIPFEAYAKFAIARETFNAQLSELKEDGCWHLYTEMLSEPSLVAQATMEQMERVQCNREYPAKVRISAIVVSEAKSTLTSSPITSVPPRPAGPTIPINTKSRTNAGVTPGAPTSVRLEFWSEIDEVDAIDQALQVLWDDAVLSKAREYSGVAGLKIYRWQLLRNRLERYRQPQATAASAAAAEESAKSRIGRLKFEDLEEINTLDRASLTELDQSVRQDFRASLPETSFGVRIGSVAFFVPVILTVSMIILAAYIRAAVNTGALESRGTVFAVLVGRKYFEIAGLLVIVIPTISLVTLADAIGLRKSSGYIALTCATVTLIATYSILKRLFPHMNIRALKKAD